MNKTINFGNYMMDAEGKMMLPIPWIIYHVAEDRMFLISQDILDYRRFSKEENNNWDESELKEWLNTTFLDTAFNEEEKAQLLEISEGEKVSLLSGKEHDLYFPNLKSLKAKYTDYSRNKTKNIYGKVFEGVFGFWWLKVPNTTLTEADLRNPHQNASTHVYVFHITNRGVANGYARSNNLDGVRPVICIKIK